MAITATTLASAADAATLDFYVTAATGASVGGFMRIDSEWSVILAISGNKISVRGRGDYGTTAVAHGVLAPVTFGLATDMPTLGATETVPVSFGDEDLRSIGADGAIPVPNRNTTYVIGKGSALATSTLANPTAAQDGLEVAIISNSDFAHVVTLVTSSDGTTGNSTTYTFAAFAGAGFKVKAFRGKWILLYQNLVTIT